MNQEVSRLIGKVGKEKDVKRKMKKIYLGLNWIQRSKFIKNLKVILKK